MDTIVIGIDGGEWDVINPLMEEGYLPTISDLIETGVHGELESITPPVSPPAWNSITTGTNPGKHGIFDFNTFGEDYQRRSINSSDRQATPFWNVMNDHNVRTGLFKIPFTYPPGEVDGFLITGFPTPSFADDFTSPPALAETIGSPAKLFQDWSYQSDGDYAGFKQNLVEVAERQNDILLQLLDEHDTDFLMTVFDGSDRAQHFFWKYFDESHPRYESNATLATAFREFYQAMDRGIADLLDRADSDTNVILLSDHGFGKLSYDIYIDEWLEQEGFLTRKDPDAPDQVVQDVLTTAIRKSWDTIESLNLDATVRSVLPESVFNQGRSKALSNASRRGTIWDETDAFFTTLSGQSIYINLEDRFVEGSVPQDEYEETIQSLRSSLLELTHPKTGEKLIRDVVRADEAFEGWAIDDSPDLIVETDPEYTLQGGRSDSLIQPSKQNENDRSGDHRKQGIFVANGPAFTEGSIDGLSVLDIAPLLLYLHKCAIPEVVDGTVPTDIFSEEAVEERTIEHKDEYGQSAKGSQEWSSEEAAELEERLSDMGYL